MGSVSAYGRVLLQPRIASTPEAASQLLSIWGGTVVGPTEQPNDTSCALTSPVANDPSGMMALDTNDGALSGASTKSAEGCNGPRSSTTPLEQVITMSMEATEATEAQRGGLAAGSAASALATDNQMAVEWSGRQLGEDVMDAEKLNHFYSDRVARSLPSVADESRLGRNDDMKRKSDHPQGLDASSAVAGPALGLDDYDGIYMLGGRGGGRGRGVSFAADVDEHGGPGLKARADAELAAQSPLRRARVDAGIARLERDLYGIDKQEVDGAGNECAMLAMPAAALDRAPGFVPALSDNGAYEKCQRRRRRQPMDTRRQCAAEKDS